MKDDAREDVWTVPTPDVPVLDPVADGVPLIRAAPSGGDGDGSVSRRAVGGVLWMTGQKWVVRILGLLAIAILTRFLSPEDFGLVAAASTVLPFFYLLTDLGFAAYIVQAKEVGQRLLSTGFWFSALASILLAGLLVLLAPLLGVLFHDDRVVPILQVLSIWVLFSAVASVPSAILRRQMRFATLAKQGATAAIVAQVVAISMVFLGFGVWALVGQSLASVAVTTVLVWLAARWRPSWTFSRPQFVAMARYGSQVLGVEFIAMLRAWAETAIISAVLGMSAVGYLSIAQRLVAIVQELTGSALVPVTSVAFTKVREDPGRLRGAYLRALRVTYAVMSPPLTLLAVAAPLIIPILFGQEWTDSFQPAQVLAIAATLTVGAALDHGLFYGLGKPGAWLIYALVVDAATVGMTALTAHWGLLAVAAGFLAVALASCVARWFLVAKLLSTKPAVLARPFGFLVTTLSLSGLAGAGTLYLTQNLPPIVAVALAAVTIGIVQAAVIWLMARQVIAEAATFLRGSSRLQQLIARWSRKRPGSKDAPTRVDEHEAAGPK